MVIVKDEVLKRQFQLVHISKVFKKCKSRPMYNWTKTTNYFSGVIEKAVYKSSEEDKKEEEVKKSLEQHDNIVTHYKNVIRVQVSNISIN